MLIGQAFYHSSPTAFFYSAGRIEEYNSAPIICQEKC
jgi:hypothetical protein